MAKETGTARLETACGPIADRMGYELVDICLEKEPTGKYLRFYIDKEGGVDINDCEAASRKISDLLDEKDPISEAYILEVSSPGLFRVLKKDKDLERSIGKIVLVKFFKAIDGEKQIRGELESFDSSAVSVRVEGASRTVQRDNVAKISLDPDL